MLFLHWVRLSHGNTAGQHLPEPCRIQRTTQRRRRNHDPTLNSCTHGRDDRSHLPGTRGNAGIKVYEDGDKFIEIGGRMQIQYLYFSESPAEATVKAATTIFFSRLRPYISGSVTKNWSGKVQFDMGKSIDRTSWRSKMPTCSTRA